MSFASVSTGNASISFFNEFKALKQISKKKNLKILTINKRKIIDNSIALSYGWKPKINLDDGFELTLKSYFSKSNK